MKYPHRLALQQRVLPAYRVPFFDELARRCEGGMALLAGQPRTEEMIAEGALPQVAQLTRAQNFHLLRGGAYVCYQRGLIRWLQASDPQALILEANPRYLAAPFALQWMRARGRKVLGWGLGAPRGAGFKRAFWSAYLNQFDGLIAYSQRGAEEYAALGFPRLKIFTAHNAAASKPSAPITRAPLRGQPTILFVGRLQARKRVDSLLRVCAALPNPPRLQIVGDGPDRARLEELAQRIFPAAEFIGAKHGAELAPYFLQADLFALPGTGGLAIQEAMSYALPVLVAKGDGTQDDLVRANNGWLIEPENEAALLDAVKNALSDSARLRSMGQESFRIVAEEINIETMAEAFTRALNACDG